ncbi:hypothetical protein SIID45300_02240 [Candidatus Magnetaquicoccaceae bacterium FCR-1]|uniref:Uncharacterized protein n=1 Tax=Candidatus Magnetaquiglobus chichijimensis TaxID=3141448 RepID=A0ABQ0CAK0_9PROT
MATVRGGLLGWILVGIVSASILPRPLWADGLEKLATDIMRSVREMTPGLPLEIHVPDVLDAAYDIPCAPLSGYLQDGLKAALSTTGRTGVRLVSAETQATLRLTWRKENDARILLTAVLTDLRHTGAPKISHQQSMRTSEIPAEARICLFDTEKVDRMIRTAGRLLLRTAPTLTPLTDRAMVDRNPIEVEPGTPLWVLARIREPQSQESQSSWWVVRLPPRDIPEVGGREVYGFVHGPLGAPRRVVLHMEGDAALAQVAGQQVTRELLTPLDLIVVRDGSGLKDALHLFIQVDPPRESGQETEYLSVAVRVQLRAEDRVVSQVALWEAEAERKRLPASKRQMAEAVRMAAEDAGRESARQLRRALEERFWILAD